MAISHVREEAWRLPSKSCTVFSEDLGKTTKYYRNAGTSFPWGPKSVPQRPPALSWAKVVPGAFGPLSEGHVDSQIHCCSDSAKAFGVLAAKITLGCGGHRFTVTQNVFWTPTRKPCGTNLQFQSSWSMATYNSKLKWQTVFGLNFGAQLTSQNCRKSFPEAPTSILEASWEPKT